MSFNRFKEGWADSVLYPIENRADLQKIDQDCGLASDELSSNNSRRSLSAVKAGAIVRIPRECALAIDPGNGHDRYVKPYRGLLTSIKVRRGDLWGALKNASGLPPGAFGKINGWSSAIGVGDTVKVAHNSPLASRGYAIEIQSGYNLGRIAELAGMHVAALARANNITDVNTLSVGQILRVPPTSVTFAEAMELVHRYAAATSTFDHLIQQMAHYFAIPPALVKATIARESGFNPKKASYPRDPHHDSYLDQASVEASRRAYGLMQVQPKTAKDMGIEPIYGKQPSGAQGLVGWRIRPEMNNRRTADARRLLGAGSYAVTNPRVQLLAGIKYLRWLADRDYCQNADGSPNWELVLAAYNAGPSRVEQAGGFPDFPSTRQYADDIMLLRKYYELDKAWREGADPVSSPSSTAPRGGVVGKVSEFVQRMLDLLR
ncbi:MAG: transglycosylase SLT domain-containing protein [Myxococcota bacterium]